MSKPILAIITDANRYDTQNPLKYFTKFKVIHFYHSAPYGDIAPDKLKEAIQWSDYRDLEKKLLYAKPDLIQGAEPYASRTQLRICLVVMKVSRKLKIPYFFPMLENRPAEAKFGPLIALVMRRFLKKYADRAELIFYLNSGARRNLEKLGVGAEKLHRLIYGLWGVDTALFAPNVEFRIKNAELWKNYILFVGRFDEAKGVEYLLEGWEKIKKGYPDVKLVFIGSGALRDKIQGSQIINLGQKKNSDLPPYFANASFSVYPSVTLKKWEEQVGTVNLQSLSCGTPVITTKSGAIPEYITSRVGVLVPERDSNALAKAMGKLLDDKKFRHKLAANARKYITDNFDAQKTVAKAEKILLEKIFNPDDL